MPPPTELPQPFQVDNVADVWTIIAALSSLGAAVGTVAAFGVAVAVYRRQVENERAALASKVTIYESMNGVVAENLGELPIYAVLLSVRLGGGGEPSSQTRTRLVHTGNVSIAGHPAQGGQAWVSFTDANGVNWIRYPDGTLRYRKQRSS